MPTIQEGGRLLFPPGTSGHVNDRRDQLSDKECRKKKEVLIFSSGKAAELRCELGRTLSSYYL